MSQRRRHRMTESQQDSLHTLLLCWRQRDCEGGKFPYYCDRLCNLLLSYSPDSRTCRSIQALTTLSSPAGSSVSHSYPNPIHSSLPPRDIVQSDPLYTGPVATHHQTCQDDQGTTEAPPPLAVMSPSCCSQTDRVFCWLCLDPV